MRGYWFEVPKITTAPNDLVGEVLTELSNAFVIEFSGVGDEKKSRQLFARLTSKDVDPDMSKFDSIFNCVHTLPLAAHSTKQYI